MVISVRLILSLVCGYISISHVTLFQQLFWSHMDIIQHMVNCFSYLYLVHLLKKIIARIIGLDQELETFCVALEEFLGSLCPCSGIKTGKKI